MKTSKENDALFEQNQTLTEQVKLLVRTEKILHSSQRVNQLRMRQMKTLSQFALRHAGCFDIFILLRLSIDYLKNLYPYHSWVALYEDNISGKCYHYKYDISSPESPTKLYSQAFYGRKALE